MKSRAFLFDLAALIPLDALQLRFGPQPLLRFPRFLKVNFNTFSLLFPYDLQIS